MWKVKFVKKKCSIENRFEKWFQAWKPFAVGYCRCVKFNTFTIFKIL